MYTKHDSCKLQYCLSLRVEFQGSKSLVDSKAVFCNCYENGLIPVLPQLLTTGSWLCLFRDSPEGKIHQQHPTSGLTKAASCADMICIKYLRTAKMLLHTFLRLVVQKWPQYHFFKSYIHYTPSENTCDRLIKLNLKYFFIGILVYLLHIVLLPSLYPLASQWNLLQAVAQILPSHMFTDLKIPNMIHYDFFAQRSRYTSFLYL